MPTSEPLDANARDLLAASVGWMNGFWDEAAGLLLPTDIEAESRRTREGAGHSVRSSVWYAAGLLLRDGSGDRARAFRALDAVLDNQWDAPGQPHHGTFRRTPNEPDPPAAPTVWRDYDPNWREFIGTVLLTLLADHEPMLPPPLVARIDAALRMAVVGTLARSVPASYTNIALMCAFLLCNVGDRFNEPGWQDAGETLAAEVERLFCAHNAFAEYNSPTYYGVDLYALALWRSYAASPRLRAMGAAMEADLWRDIARYYHAGLGNLCGPYDRSYGMDMWRYPSLASLWIWAAVGGAHAPFPDWTRPFAHANDFSFGPCIARVGARIPADALPHFYMFHGERRVEQVIASAPHRVATAWLAPDVMFGGEKTSGSVPGNPQFHPATAHWRCPDGSVGWLKLVHTAPIDARATRGCLSISCPVPEDAFVFQCAAPGIDRAAIQPDAWRLPGLTIHVESDAPEPSVVVNGESTEIRYLATDPPRPMAWTLTVTTDSTA